MTILDRLPATADPDALFEAFSAWASDQGLALYPAQEEAIIDVVSGSNLILSTPTGSGKSLVAVAAHFSALARDEVSFYTAPIKALVSEKFFALVGIFGADNVGMMTGDATVNADAPIICCTAEILANLALREGAQADVGQVVMDEFHFYADPTGGGPGRCRCWSCPPPSSCCCRPPSAMSPSSSMTSNDARVAPRPQSPRPSDRFPSITAT